MLVEIVHLRSTSCLVPVFPPVSSVLKPLQDRPSLQKPSPGRAPQPKADGLEASQPLAEHPKAIAPYSNPVDTGSLAGLRCSGSLEMGEKVIFFTPSTFVVD